MSAAAAALPPLPADLSSGDAAGVVPAGIRPPQGVSPFAGGYPTQIVALRGIEFYVNMLMQSTPSLAPIGGAIIAQLRQVVPQAMMAGSPNAGAPQGPPPGAGIPLPPGGPQGPPQ